MAQARPEAATQSRLRRSAEAFRDRDWVGIAIEVAVVTLGVLLAFQIDQWAQDRRQAREERQFLERMWRETDEAIRENDWVISLHAVNRRALMQGLALRSNPQALAQYRQGGCGADSLPGLGFNDTGYEELGNSGRLNIVSDPQLRMQLRRVMAAQADAVAQLNYSRQRGTRIRQALEPYLRLDVDRDGKRSCTTNWPALVKDPLAVNAIVLAERNHVLMWWKRAYTRDLLATAHNRIACRLGKQTDCLDRVPQIVGRRNYSDIIPPALARKFDETANMWTDEP
jgi:hypothetical protein